MDTTVPSPAAGVSLEDAQNSFYASLKSIPNFVIAVGEYEWAVHSAIFAQKSPFFKALMEGNFQESSQRKATLEDVSPLAVARVIIYIYYNDILINSCSTTGIDRGPGLRDMLKPADLPEILLRAIDEIDAHLELYTLADRFMIEGLHKQVCIELEYSIENHLPRWWRVKEYADSAQARIGKFCDDKKFQEMLKSDDAFAADLMRAFAKRVVGATDEDDS